MEPQPVQDEPAEPTRILSAESDDDIIDLTDDATWPSNAKAKRGRGDDSASRPIKRIKDESDSNALVVPKTEYSALLDEVRALRAQVGKIKTSPAATVGPSR